MIGDRQMAFAEKFTIYTEFKKITGLQAGRDRPRVGREGRIDHVDLAADLAERQVPG